MQASDSPALSEFLYHWVRLRRIIHYTPTGNKYPWKVRGAGEWEAFTEHVFALDELVSKAKGQPLK